MSSDLRKGGKEAEPKKASEQILRHEVVEGVDALERPLGSLFTSGLSAGLGVGFSLFVGQGISMTDFGRFLLWTTLGNTFGGSVFVALIKYSYASRGRRLG